MSPDTVSPDSCVEEHGVPLSIVVTGANAHDIAQIEEVLRSAGVAPPEGETRHLCADKGYDGEVRRLCADKGYDSEAARETMRRYGYIPHVRSRGAEADAKRRRGAKARRWVVECAPSGFNRLRKILVRYEKTLSSYLALLHLSAAIVCWRKAGVICG